MSSDIYDVVESLVRRGHWRQDEEDEALAIIDKARGRQALKKMPPAPIQRRPQDPPPEPEHPDYEKIARLEQECGIGV